MSRRTTALCAALSLAAGVACWIFLHPDQVTQASFDKLGMEMTFSEVDELFGREPDQVRNIHGIVLDESTFTTHIPEGTQPEDQRVYRVHQWTSAELTAVVIFEKGRVVCRYARDGQPDAWHQRFWRAVDRSLRKR